MIYQLTPFSEKLREPFSPLYKNFVMEEDPFILSEFPRADERKALVEYLGLYYCWKKEKHDWIGFTSYRQMDKCPFIFEDEVQIRGLLKEYDILSWMVLDLKDHLAHTCARHPRLFSLLNKMALRFPRKGPLVYCNYFVMSWDNFDAYMKWSWPLVVKMLSLQGDPILSLKRGHYSNLGAMVERLFIIWHTQNEKKIMNVFPESDLIYKKKEMEIPLRYRFKYFLKEAYFRYLTD